jgi:hypothetical protein
MAATIATVTLSIQYTPPSAPANSGNVSYQVSANCQAQNVGQIDINPSDAPATLFVIPFGSIGAAKIFVLKNKGTVDIGVRLNGAVTDTFRLAPGGEWAYAMSAAPTAGTLTGVTVAVITSPAQVEYTEYMAFGD